MIDKGRELKRAKSCSFIWPLRSYRFWGHYYAYVWQYNLQLARQEMSQKTMYNVNITYQTTVVWFFYKSLLFFAIIAMRLHMVMVLLSELWIFFKKSPISDLFIYLDNWIFRNRLMMNNKSIVITLFLGEVKPEKYIL